MMLIIIVGLQYRRKDQEGLDENLRVRHVKREGGF